MVVQYLHSIPTTLLLCINHCLKEEVQLLPIGKSFKTKQGLASQQSFRLINKSSKNISKDKKQPQVTAYTIPDVIPYFK